MPRKEAIRFLGLFASMVAVFYILTAIPWVDRHLVYPVLELTADGASALLKLMGSQNTVKGVVIQGGDFSVAVRRGCDPLEPSMLFCAAVIAFPSAWRPKLLGMTVGVVFLFCLNLTRILTLYWSGKNHSGWFESLHQEWWPALFIVCALLLWLAWLRWLLYRAKTTHA